MQYLCKVLSAVPASTCTSAVPVRVRHEANIVCHSSTGSVVVTARSSTIVNWSVQYPCSTSAVPVRVGHEEKIWEVRGTTPNVSNASSRTAEEQRQNMKEV